MYNQFSHEELSFILELIKESDIDEMYIDMGDIIINKITEEIVPNDIFIDFFTKHDNDIMYIYKYKSEAKYKIIVSNTSTKKVKELCELEEKFLKHCPNSSLEFLVCSYSNSDKFNDDIHLVYERK